MVKQQSARRLHIKVTASLQFNVLEWLKKEKAGLFSVSVPLRLFICSNVFVVFVRLQCLGPQYENTPIHIDGKFSGLVLLGVSLTLCCFVVYSTRRFDSCLTLCYFFLVFFSPFSIAITSLGKERVNLRAFRTLVRFALVWICLFFLPFGV